MVKSRIDEYGNTYELILMDYSMPELNGDEATKIIRAQIDLHNIA